jgi:hypothetical protein
MSLAAFAREQKETGVRRGARGLAVLGALLVASCGRPDASGVYLSKSDREAVLIRLAQAKDGAVTGRIEVIALGPDGAVSDDSATLNGAASKHELVFKPAGVWLGGAGASGSFTRDGLTIRRNGIDVTARKASLDDFQKAVSQLKARAAKARRQAADVQATEAGQGAGGAAFEDAADKGAKLREAAAGLQADAAKLNAAVSAAPDFSRQAADNTARIAGMASGGDRGRLAASASQVIVETNQIDVARTRYAIVLDQIVARAAPIATAVQRFCDTPPAAPFGQPCTEAKAAATDFESALVRAATVFKGHKLTVQTELARQNQIARKIGG